MAGFGSEMLLFCVRHKRDVLLEVVGVFVVGLVREAPGMIRRKQA